MARESMSGAPPDGKYLLRSDTQEDRASQRRGRKRIVYIAGAVLLAVVVVGVCIGVGVGVSKRDGKAKHGQQAAAGPATNATEVRELKYLPAPGTPEAAQLLLSGTNITKLMYQLEDDAASITTAKAVAFLAYFDSLANLTGRGVDVGWYQEQAYFLRGWFTTRRYTAALELLRKFAKGQAPALTEVAGAVEQLYVVLRASADFTAFRSWPKDKGDGITDEQVEARDAADTRMMATSNILITQPGKVDPATAGRRPKKLLVNPFQQYTNVINPQGWMNNPTAMGYPGFKPIVIPLVFHLLLFRDAQGYLGPRNAYATGDAPGRYVVSVMNKAYKSANIQFRLHEWRADAAKYPYLNLGTLENWQSCAAQAESCTCPLAKANNVDSRGYINIYVCGGSKLPSYSVTDGALGYSTIIAQTRDTCRETVPGWTTPETESRHLWMLFDEMDPGDFNRPEAFNQGPVTMVHEVGHQLGLSHTHQGDCSDKDGISDTPPNLVIEDQPYSSQTLAGLCRAAWKDATKQISFDQVKDMNTCTGDAYIDNIMNYMSYTPYECNMLFTSEQVKRMQRVVDLYYNRFVIPGGNARPNSRGKAPPKPKPKPKPTPKPAPKRATPKPKTPPPKSKQPTSPRKAAPPAGRR